MADPYIDQDETLIYGPYAVAQMEKVCLGRVKELDGMVKFAIAAQQQANADMKAVLDKQPKPESTEDPETLYEETRDTIVRFGSYLGSLKGYPVDAKLFFKGEAPSVFARKRIVKLIAAVKAIGDEIPKHAAIADPTWLKDFKSIHKRLEKLDTAQRGTKVAKVDLGPEVATQREKWLAVYNANKLLIRGLLAHVGKPELMPLVFDDLAEVHRVTGVTDALPVSGAPGDKSDKSDQGEAPPA